MKMVTINEASKALGVPRLRISRAVDAGELRSMPLGARRVIELSEAEAYFAKKHGQGVGIDALSTATGLPVSAIRKGVREGWIPSWRDGRRGMRFDIDAVYAAITARMQGNSET